MIYTMVRNLYLGNGISNGGEYKDDKRNGQGTYNFSDGRVWGWSMENDDMEKYAKGEYKDFSSF